MAVTVTAGAARTGGTAGRRQITRAAREVGHCHGDTPAVCRASCIDPKVFELFELLEQEVSTRTAPAVTRLGEARALRPSGHAGAVEAAALDLLDDACAQAADPPGVLRFIA